MKAIWGFDYDCVSDEKYRCPVCPKCEVRFDRREEGYKCVYCGQKLEVDEEMEKWIVEREGEKVEMRDCVRIRNSGCDKKGVLETHMMKNPCTLEWIVAWAVCRNCGRRLIV